MSPWDQLARYDQLEAAKRRRRVFLWKCALVEAIALFVTVSLIFGFWLLVNIALECCK